MMMRWLPVPLLAVVLLPGCRTSETPDQQVNDVEIMADVKSKLASDIGLTTVPDISVNSTNGVVTLSGAVDSPATRVKAEEIARGVPHVVRVVNNIQIAPHPSARRREVPLWRAAVWKVAADARPWNSPADGERF